MISTFVRRTSCSPIRSWPRSELIEPLRNRAREYWISVPLPPPVAMTTDSAVLSAVPWACLSVELQYGGLPAPEWLSDRSFSPDLCRNTSARTGRRPGSSFQGAWPISSAAPCCGDDREEPRGDRILDPHPDHLGQGTTRHRPWRLSLAARAGRTTSRALVHRLTIVQTHPAIEDSLIIFNNPSCCGPIVGCSIKPIHCCLAPDRAADREPNGRAGMQRRFKRREKLLAWQLIPQNDHTSALRIVPPNDASDFAPRIVLPERREFPPVRPQSNAVELLDR